jgi:PAS domain S-box-containing protein
MSPEPTRSDDDASTGRLAAQAPFSPGALRLPAPARYAVAGTAVLLAFFVQLWLNPQPGIAPFVFFFAAVAIASWLGGWGPGLLSVAFSAALANHAFVEPAWSWSVSPPALAATALFVVAGSIVALLCSSFRQSIFRIERAAQALRQQSLVQAQADTALRESEARFRNLAEALPQMVFDLDAAGRDGYFNAQWHRYTGRAPADFGARMSLVHPEDRARVAARWAQAVREGLAYECEYRFLRHDGQHRWVLARALPVRDAEGRVTRWFGSATDIHVLKETEEALREAGRRRDEFLAMLSHELRNPLAPITSGLYILEHAAAGGDQARRAVDVIARQTAQLSSLVNQLLDATRLSRSRIELSKRRLDLNQVVGRTIEDHRSLFEQAGVRLEFRSAESPVVLEGDATRLGQVVGNLLQNAAKFTSKGGLASVRVGLEGETATIRVRDDGAGIARDMMDQLFQPFMQGQQTLDRTKGGLGLGLALAKGIVELHGGTVAAASAGPGAGAEFVVRLPTATGPVVSPRQHSAPRVTKRQRILVIEDNLDSASTLREALELLGHETTVAHTGPEGIECARACLPDVILCDIGLPGMDGYSVGRAIRNDSTLKGVRLVALSGYALPEDLERAERAGFDAHLPKPADIEELAALIGS